MKDNIKKIFNSRKFIDYLILILIAYIVIIPMFNEKVNIYLDDGIQHIARAYGTFEAIKEGNFLGNVISSFSNNFGYSWNLFYGPLSIYGIIIIKFFCKSYFTAYKIFVSLCLFFSAISMYRLVLEITEKNNIALVSGAIYVTFPYHLTDLYTRNALGEYVSFIFIPIVFLGLYQIINTKKQSYNLVLGMVGLLLTHNISTMLVIVFAIIYVCINIKKIAQKDKIKLLCINILFVLSLTSFFWIPMIQTKMFSSYQVYEPDAMSTLESVQKHALKINQIFVTNRNESFVFELGLHVIIMLAFSIMTLRLLKEKRKEYIFFLVSGFISLWMCTKYFPWKYMPKIFLLVQFPWRLMFLVGFFFSIVCSINMSVVIKKFNIKDAIIILIICVLYTISLKDFIQYDNYMSEIYEYGLGIISGMENELIIGEGKGEYLPTKAYNNRFYIATREDAIYVLEGRAIIENENKSGSNYSAKIRTIEQETVFELPYIYYPGYKVVADGMNIDTFETENGFLGMKLSPNDNVKLEVSYEGTNLMKISLLISIISLLLFIIFLKKINCKKQDNLVTV